MLCTDVQIEGGLPEPAFIKEWNYLVDKKEYFLPEWQQIIEGDDLLEALVNLAPPKTKCTLLPRVSYRNSRSPFIIFWISRKITKFQTYVST